VQRQFLGNAAKLLFARGQIMSEFCVPKITKFGKFFIVLFKNKNVDVFETNYVRREEAHPI